MDPSADHIRPRHRPGKFRRLSGRVYGLSARNPCAARDLHSCRGLPKLIPLRLPIVAYCSVIGLLVASPISPVREFVIESANKINFTAPLTLVGAYAGISISDQIRSFLKQGWKMIIVGVLVMTGTFLGSAIISQVVLSLTGAI